MERDAEIQFLRRRLAHHEWALVGIICSLLIAIVLWNLLWLAFVDPISSIFWMFLEGTPLPYMTQAVFNLHRSGFLLALAALPQIGAVILLIQSRTKPWRWYLALGVLVFSVVIFLIIFTALMLPLIPIFSSSPAYVK